jgi:hypothetical protein
MNTNVNLQNNEQNIEHETNKIAMKSKNESDDEIRNENEIKTENEKKTSTECGSPS